MSSLATMPDQDAPDIIRFPCQQPPAHRIQTPGRTPPPSAKSVWAVDSDQQAMAERSRQRHRKNKLPDRDLAKSLTLRQFCDRFYFPFQKDRVDRGKYGARSFAKDKQALNLWDRYSPDDEWPTGKKCYGVPLFYINGDEVTRILEQMNRDMSVATVRSNYNHIRQMFRYARGLKLMRLPKPDFSNLKLKRRRARKYKDEEIAIAYRSLAPWVDLQVAFVLAINSGLRCGDLFGLTWANFDLASDVPSLFSLEADKTEKDQGIPLAPITVRQLKRLPSYGSGGLLFPGRSNPDAKDPEKSRPAKRRNRDIKQAFAAAGLGEFKKPFQSARVTCNSRLERTCGGAGVYVLGHGLTLNSRSYNDFSDLIVDVINRVQQPACFSEF